MPRFFNTAGPCDQPPSPHLLLLSFHHIVIDAVSIGFPPGFQEYLLQLIWAPA